LAARNILFHVTQDSGQIMIPPFLDTSLAFLDSKPIR
jgi:hypothetical protein